MLGSDFVPLGQIVYYQADKPLDHLLSFLLGVLALGLTLSWINYAGYSQCRLFIF